MTRTAARTRPGRGRLRSALALLAFAAGCRGPHPGRDVGSCAHLQAVREVRGTNLCEDGWSCVRPPGGPFDRVGLHRLALCQGANGPLVLYLPGMHMNAELPTVDPQRDLRLYLAAAGLRTWGIDYRTHAVPADAAAADLDALRAWTPAVFLGDVDWAAGFVRGTEPGALYVAGFSQGAALAYRLAAEKGADLAGLIILDGTGATGAAAGEGAPAIDVGSGRLPFPARQALLAAVARDPAAPSPLPGFASAGDALAGTLYTAPSFGGEGGLANTRAGVSDVRELALLLQRYDRWWPRAMLAGGPGARPRRALPVVAFASTKLGPAWVERVRAAARAFGGADAEVHELPGYGHLDVLAARRAASEVFQPTLEWLRRRPFP